MLKRLRSSILCSLGLISLPLAAASCTSVSVTEIRGRTAFGPEFRNFGTNTHDIRYAARQGVELRMSNDWTAGVMYQRRDVDEGSGDNENLVLFEVGYPIWKGQKKPEKTALQIQELEKELQELGSLLAEAETETASDRFVRVEDTKSLETTKKENSYAQP